MNNKFMNLNLIGWIIFSLFLGLNIYSLVQNISKEVIVRELPFKIVNGRATSFQDSTLAKDLNELKIIKIDTLTINPETTEKTDDNNFKFHLKTLFTITSEADEEENSFTENLSNLIAHKRLVQITYLQDGKRKIRSIPVRKEVNVSALSSTLINLVFLLFIFFNSFLLLKYSIAKENILIVLFLLFISSPGNLNISGFSLILELLSSCLAGPLFYHFILKKIHSKRSPKLIYFISFALSLITFFVSIIFHTQIVLVLYIWSIIWIFIAFLVLWQAYKKTSSIELKRLMNAFSGIFISLISIVIVLICALILAMTFNGAKEFQIYNIQTAIFAILILISLLGFFVGILWFFGAFTWSLLTGTTLGVKIRSTMIYTIVGVFFVTIFGFLDYTLGEILQSIFGRFLGSEFIAGIPATIGLLIFFNPVRHKVENLVDKKLNTSDLNFLESTDSFADTLADEGVIEGFEEYICENLIARLPITKVALISYDENMGDYKFNEIRGSNVIENSAVTDSHKILVENKIHRISIPLSNIQDCSSFALVIPIIFDDKDRWFIAFGEKKDDSYYNKRDEMALIKLTDRIKLSLKFILAYEGIVNRKFQLQIKEKELEIIKLKKQLKQ